MPSPDYFVYDGDITNGANPRRPSLQDVGGGTKIDDQDFPPDPVTMFAANDFNQAAFQCVALAKVNPCALLIVTNSGTPTISSLRSASTALRSSPVTTVGSVTTCGDFVLTRHAAGDVEIQCPASKLIPPLAPAAVTQVAGDFRSSARVNGTGDGIRIETRNASGTLVDADFVVMWV